MKNLLENKLKFDYENLHETPSVGLWERLENELEGKKVSPKRSIGWWKYAAAILLLISFSVFVFIFNNKNAVSVEQAMVQKTTSEPKTNEKINPTVIEKTNVTKFENQEKIVTIETENFNNKFKENQIENTPKSIVKEDKTPEIVSKEEEIVSPKPIEEKEILVENKVNKSIPKYVRSEDLLFGRELQKASIEQENTKSKMGNLDLKVKNPKTIEILGFTVYSEESEKK